jgi:metal-sulfur cluster biosynthetic enzyme
MNTKKVVRIIVFVLLLCGTNVGLLWLARSTHFNGGDEGISVPATAEGIRRLLTSVQDPELGISVVDLGLIRNIEVKPDKKVVITVILTTPLCPLMDMLVSEISKKVKKINGITDVEVRIDKTVVWNRDMMTASGKQKLEKPSE